MFRHAIAPQARHVNVQIVTFRTGMISSCAMIQSETFVLYGDIVDVCQAISHHTILLLIWYREKFAEWNSESHDEHSTQISGSGWVTSTKPLCLCLIFHILQHVHGGLPIDDIGIAYYVNAIGDFLALEDFPSPSSFVRFSGELATCEMKILSNKLQTACISIYQE